MRILKTLFPCLLLVLVGCNTGETEKDYLYVIKSPVIYSEDSLDYSDPVFYGQNNFILYDSKTILYHEINCFGGGECGTGMDYSKPGKLYLTPEKLIKIKYSELDYFLKTKFKGMKHHTTIISIGSSMDTVRNPGYTVLMNFKNRHKNILASVRKWTEEEAYVATAKMNNKEYNPAKIKWKVGFADGNEWIKERSIQFLPPVVEGSENTTKPANKRKLTKYFYPNMSFCGGGLYGYYDDTTLVKIDATYGFDQGMSRRIIEYDKGTITRITFSESYAEVDKYRKKYPDDTEFDNKKMTYTNEQVKIDFYPVKKIRTYSNNKPVKKSISQEEIDQLINCAKSMEEELASEKIIEKDE